MPDDTKKKKKKSRTELKRVIYQNRRSAKKSKCKKKFSKAKLLLVYNILLKLLSDRTYKKQKELYEILSIVDDRITTLLDEKRMA